jgi:hypothetical protein
MRDETWVTTGDVTHVIHEDPETHVNTYKVQDLRRLTNPHEEKHIFSSKYENQISKRHMGLKEKF